MGRLISVFLFSLLVFGVFYLYKSDRLGIISPIPKAYGVSSATFPQNTWFPKNVDQSRVLGVKNLPSLSLSAKSAILVDYDSGEVIFSKDPKARLPVASDVKIMTALVALEKKKLSDTFTVSQKAYKAGEDSMDLATGEKLTLNELLYGLILVSGNDAAVTVAENVAESEDNFVNLMNQRVRDLGLSDSKFINASGLDVDGQTQYSTAWDLSTIAHYLWQNHPEFQKISETYHWTLDATVDHKAFDLYNDTNLLTTYPGVRGIKPGFTWDAGWCLVTYAENGGHRLIGVILGSGDRRGEMKELLDYGFSYWGTKVSHPGLDLEG